LIFSDQISPETVYRSAFRGFWCFCIIFNQPDCPNKFSPILGKRIMSDSYYMTVYEQEHVIGLFRLLGVHSNHEAQKTVTTTFQMSS
jgi:hypothetical protein